MMKRLLTYILLLATLAATAQEKKDSTLRNTLDNLVVRSVIKQELFPEERVYLHFDNNSYYLGESIWFKAYVTSGTQDTPTTISRVLYVELVAPEGYVVRTQKYKIDDNGTCDGSFELNEQLLSGYYEVRSYTRYMLNRGKDAVFSRVFPVFDKVKNGDYTFRNMLDRRRAFLVDIDKDSSVTGLDRKMRWENGKLPEWDIKFYPEGGHLLEGVETRVAYEIFGPDGINSGKSITVFADGDELFTATPEHMGKGTFLLNPQKGVKYSAAIHGNKKKFRLPEAESEGVAITLDHNSSTIGISVKNTIVSPVELGCALVHRGKTNFYERFSSNEKSIYFAIDRNTLPEGVNRVILFAGEGLPLAERMFFVTHDGTIVDDRPTARLLVKSNDRPLDNLQATPHGKITLSIEREDGTPLTGGNFSLAVTDADTPLTTSYSYNIYTYMLLGSEVKGYIPDAARYFNPANGNRTRELDLVMLTHGWTSYDWSKLCNRFADLAEPIEKGITVNGRFIKKKPNRRIGKLDKYIVTTIPDSRVKFEITYRDSNVTKYDFKTDEKGEFRLNTKDFYGKKVAKLTPALNSLSTRDSIFAFNLDRYFSPAMRLYDYWERNTGKALTQERLKEEREEIIRINPFEYLLTQVEVVSKKKRSSNYRPPRSEMRLDFLDEWEYAQDVTYLTNRIDPWDPTGYRSYGHYESPFVNHIFDHSTPYGIKEYSLGAPTLSSFDRYVMGSNGGLNSGGNGIVVDVFGGMNKIRRQSSFLIQDPAYHNTLTAVDIMRSAFWRHNLNWCYWIQGMVLDGEYHTDSIPRSNEEYTAGVNVSKMLDFKEIVIRSDENTRKLYNGKRVQNGNTKSIKTYDYSTFYHLFTQKTGIPPRNWDIDDAPDAITFERKSKNAQDDEMPNYVACFIPNSEKERAGSLIPQLSHSSSARYTLVYGYTQSKQFYAPDYSTLRPDSSVRDYRRTLLWVPQATAIDGKIKVELYNNSTARSIDVNVEGYADGTFYSTDSTMFTRRIDDLVKQRNEAERTIRPITGIDTPELLAHCFLKNEEGRKLFREKEYNEAFKLFNEAAALGYPDAVFNTAVCTMLGLGTEQDSIKGFISFRKAANLGNKAALHNLASCYMHGVGTHKNDSLAIKYYTLSAENGYAASQTILADCYMKGIGVKPDSAVAYDWYMKAAGQEEPVALFILGQIKEKEDIAAGLSKRKMRKSPAGDYYTRAAKAGHREAQFKLAQFHEKGTYVKKSRKRAFHWYHEAANQQHPKAMERVAYCYEKGRGTKKNEFAAARWYRLAEKQGSELAKKKIKWYDTFRFFE